MASDFVRTRSSYARIHLGLLLVLLTKRCAAYAPLWSVGQQARDSRILHPQRLIRRSDNLCALAKKSKKKKGGQQKTSVSLDFDIVPTEGSKMRELAELLVTSYKAATGKDIFQSGDVSIFANKGGDVPKKLFKHPVAVIVVEPLDEEASTEGNSEVLAASGGRSKCVYANLAACETYGYPDKNGWKSVIDKPCMDLVAEVPKGKFESGYNKKLTIVADGAEAPVSIKDASRWTLEKMALEDGKLGMQKLGVAYAWETWELEDGTIRKPGGIREQPPLPPEEVQAAINAQGAFIRKLKEEDGLTNADAEVKDAVAELLRLKALQE